MATILKDAAYMALPMNIKRGNPIPLDTTTVWYDQDELEAYATSNPTAYVGQIVVLVDETGLTATAYMISNTSGTLVRLAATTSSGDLASDVATLQSQVATLVASVGTKLEESTITATNLWAAVEEIKNATGATIPEYTLVKKESANENAAATYYLTKDGARVGVEIDIPKDMVVSSGSVETYTQETLPSGVETPGTYIVLVLANATNDKLYIAADSLIEYVTSGSTAGDPVFITVDPTTHKITATLTDGSIAKAKLDATVQASLAKADAAVIGNAAIPAGTHAKITYDEKGLVTGGEDLSESDLPALSIGKITGLQTALDSKASADALSTTDGKVTTLIGDDTAKSVRTIANEELAAQLIPEGAAESLNTLQEIAAWIQEHPDDASAMNSAITALQAQLTGIGSGSGTVKAYVDAAISALNIGDYVTASALAAAIGNLDVDDAAVEGQVVSAVSEVDGKIQVSRRALVAADIPTLAVDKISGLQTALDSKVNSDALADVATSGKMEDLSQDTYIVLNCGSSSVNV